MTSPNTKIKYTVYESDTKISDSLIESCSLKQEAGDPGTTKYWYDGCSANSTILDGTEKLATVEKDASELTGDVISVEGLKLENVTTASPQTHYYYLVVEYVNSTTLDQNDDMGSSISIKVTGVSGATYTVQQ